MPSVPHLNPPHQVEIAGFELADGVAHMIAWLGRGADFRQFVVNDMEEELYWPTPGAQLLEVRRKAEPQVATSVKQADAVSSPL